MLISVRQLRLFWNVRPVGVLHVGAHEAEELDAYRHAGWSPVLWIEGLPDKASQLKEQLKSKGDQEVVQALVWDTDGELLSLHRANNGQSSSAFRLGTHRIEHPEVHVVEEIPLRSSRLDTLLAGTDHRFDFINIDIQGAELRALQGLGDRIRGVKWIYCEVNEEPLYEGANLINEIDSFLQPKGFRRVDTDMTTHGWGDALYIHTAALPRLSTLRQNLRRFSTRATRSRPGRRLSAMIGSLLHGRNS